MSDNKKSSGWWFDDYNYDYRSHVYSKGSGSRSWLDKIGIGVDYWKPKKNANEVYQDLLNQLQNSANLIGEDSMGEIKVSWSDGTDVNKVTPNKNGENVIYLSPDNLVSTDGKDSKVSEEILDAMTGKIYLASTLRETVDPASYKDASIARRSNSEVDTSAVTIWEAIETSIARSHILDNWNGFGPYIASDAERSSASKSAVQDYIDASVTNPNVDAASVAIAWNLLNGSDPIEIPDCYNECIETASEVLENEIDPKDRFSTCRELSDKISQILKCKKDNSEGDSENSDSSSESGGGGGNSDSEDESDNSSDSSDESDDSGDESDDSGTDSEKSGSKPKVCDSDLLGKVVENKTDRSLADQSAQDEADSEGSAISVKPEEGINNLGEKFELLQVPVLPSYHLSLKQIISNHRREISTIRSSLQFRNNDHSIVSYGHRTGDIDENSLFKIKMNDDRVMTKVDTVGSKKIAICLLVDESGSMGCCTEDGERIDSARNVAVVLAESLRSVAGIDVSIYGHTAEEDYSNPSVAIREYYSPRQKDLAACIGLDARRQNHDSWAIQHTANIFNRDFSDYDRKILFVISDGEPAGGGYGGHKAMSHMLKVSKACESKRIEVYGIGVDSAFSDSAGKLMYGDNRFVILSDVKSSLGVMTRFIRQVAMK